MSGQGFLGNMTENLHADCVQSRQAGFIQCFPRFILPEKVDSVNRSFQNIKGTLQQE